MAKYVCYIKIENNLKDPDRTRWSGNDIINDQISNLLYNEENYIRKVSTWLNSLPQKYRRDMQYAFKIDRWFRRSWIVSSWILKEKYRWIMPVMDEVWNVQFDENWRILRRWEDGKQFIMDDYSEYFEWWDFSFKDIPDMIFNWKREGKDDGRWYLMAVPARLDECMRFIREELCTEEALESYWLPSQMAAEIAEAAEDFTNYQKKYHNDPYWWKKTLSMFLWDWVNKWKMIYNIYPKFQEVLNDQDKLIDLFWIIFTKDGKYYKRWYRQFVEQVAVLAWEQRSSRISWYDLLTEEQKAELYNEWEFNFRKEDWTTYSWHVDRNMFNELSFRDQYRILQHFFPEQFSSSIDRAKAYIKVKIWWTLLDKIDHFCKNILQPSMYLIAMSIAELKSVANLTWLNTMMFITDKINWLRYRNIDWDWKWLLRKYAILQEFDDWDFDWLDFSTKNLGNQIFKVAEKTNKILWAWVFNAADTVMWKDYMAKRLSYFFQTRFPRAKTVEDVDNELIKMSNNQRETLLKSAEEYVDTWLFNETWQARDFTLWRRVHATESIFLQPANNLKWHLWDFLKWRWRNKRAAAVKQVKNLWDVLKSDYWKEYLEFISRDDVTPENVQYWLHSKALNNIDAIDFVSKIWTAFYLSRLAVRAHDNADTDLAERKAMDDVSELFELFSNFNWDLAALRILPEWQMFEAFVGNLIYETWDWLTTDIWAASWEAALQAAKNFCRWLRLFRWTLLWWTQYFNKIDTENPNIDVIDMWKQMFSGILSMATAYSFYSNYEIETAGVTKYVPKSYTLGLYEMTWIPPKVIKDFRELTDDYKTYKAYNSWTTWLWNWLKYRIPFIAEYNKWWFDSYDKFTKALNELKDDAMYINMAEKWIIPDNLSADAKIFWYNKVTQLLMDKNDKMNRFNFHIDKSYELDWEKMYAWSNQVYQDLSAIMLSQWITHDQLESAINLIDDDSPFYNKRAARALAFLDSRVPWSAIEVIAYLMNKEWDDAFHKKYWKYTKYTEVTDLDDAYFKIAAFDKYSKYLYDADMYRTYPQLVLRALKDRKDLTISSMISDPDASEYWELDLMLNEDDTFWSRKLLNEFKIELLTQKAINQWDYNAYKMNNLYTNLFNPSPNDINKDWSMKTEYIIEVLDQAKIISEKLEWYWLPSWDKAMIKAWLYASLDRFLPELFHSWRYNDLSDEDKNIVQSVLHLMRWSVNELEDLSVSDAEDAIMEKINDSYKKKWYSTTKNYRTWPNVSSNLKYYINKLKNWIKTYSSYKDQNFKYTYNRNGSVRYYTEKELEKLLAKSKPWEWVISPGWTTKSWWGSRSQWYGNQNKPGWSVSQYAWSARPKGAKTEDPDKGYARWEYWKVKRMRKTSSQVKAWALNATRRRLSPKVKTWS